MNELMLVDQPLVQLTLEFLLRYEAVGVALALARAHGARGQSGEQVVLVPVRVQQIPDNRILSNARAADKRKQHLSSPPV